MTKTIPITDTARRAFLAGSAVTIAAAAVVGPAATSIEADPIFPAIENHRAATAASRLAVDRHAELDAELPMEKCRSSITSWEEKIVTTDDPRWIDNCREVNATFDAETIAACALVNILPTTFTGVVALLHYAVSADRDGQTWPDDLFADETEKRSRSWHHFLVANLAEVLPAMVLA